ncbi:hypothetical protein RhiirA4_456041 [Rhizophagus irregularis]|uniref:Uncharacterized protein n=1 Tax=Rhizophagus irregularis TaxID=588596 RepID=A0A2I1G6M0_9GLOM|nr:hypothetical protein RhiirA4_456041 [Rhizophagus irregularis]
MLYCETKYTLENKVLYTITWKEGRAEWIVSSKQSASGAVNAFLKSKISGIHIFGFDIEVLHQIRIGEIGESHIEKTTVIDKRKRPLSEVVSVSQQNKRYASFGRDAHKKIKQLILQHRMVLDSGEPIHLRNMELEYEDHIVNIKYDFSSDHLKLDAYVHACDEALLLEAWLIREYQVAQRRIEITKLINVQIPIRTINLDKELNQQPILDDGEEHQGNPNGIMVDEQEIGNGVYRSIRNLLQIFIPIWNKSNPPTLQPGNTVYLKLGGDGRNVSRKEKYETLAKVENLFKYQLQLRSSRKWNYH